MRIFSAKKPPQVSKQEQEAAVLNQIIKPKMQRDERQMFWQAHGGTFMQEPDKPWPLVSSHCARLSQVSLYLVCRHETVFTLLICLDKRKMLKFFILGRFEPVFLQPSIYRKNTISLSSSAMVYCVSRLSLRNHQQRPLSLSKVPFIPQKKNNVTDRHFLFLASKERVSVGLKNAF